MKTMPYSLFFTALANEPRMRIVACLKEGPKAVGRICQETGLEQSLVSHHLKCLTFCGFVSNKRQGKRRIYSLNEETLSPLLRLAEKHIDRFATQLRKCEVLRY